MMAMKMPDGKLQHMGKRTCLSECSTAPSTPPSSILYKIAQRPVLSDSELDSPISFEEVDAAINKLKNGKAPGLNGITPEAYKTMHKYASWNQSQGVPPNKWHRVILIDVCSKIFSSVMNGWVFHLHLSLAIPSKFVTTSRARGHMR